MLSARAIFSEIILHGGNDQRGKVKSRQYRIAIAAMYAGRFYVLHHSHHVKIGRRRK